MILLLTFSLVIFSLKAYVYPKFTARVSGIATLLKSSTETIKTSDLVNAFFSTQESQPAKGKISEIGRNLLSTIKLPTGKDEAWKHNNLNRLLEPSFKRAKHVSESFEESSVTNSIDIACINSCLVFIDGKYSSALSSTSALSPEHVDFISMKASSDFLSKTVSDLVPLLNSEKVFFHVPDQKESPRNSFASDVLTALNMASCEDIAVLRVRKGVSLSTPVQVLYYSSSLSSTGSSVAHTRLAVIVEEGSSLSLKQTFAGGKVDTPKEASRTVAAIVNSNTRILLQKGAAVTHTYVQVYHILDIFILNSHNTL